MDADLDLLLTAVFARLTISCLSGRGTPREASQTRRSSRSASRRRSWASRLTGGSLAVAAKRLRHLFPSCPSSPATSSAAAGWRTRWSG